MIRVFFFVLKYGGYLKRVPFLPLVFDCMQRVFMVLSFSEVPAILNNIEEQVCRWTGATSSLHRFGGMQYNVNGREFGHIHSNGILDIRFNKVIKQELMAEGRISDHHFLPASGWISFFIRSRGDEGYALELLRRSYLNVTVKEKYPTEIS